MDNSILLQTITYGPFGRISHDPLLRISHDPVARLSRGAVPPRTTSIGDAFAHFREKMKAFLVDARCRKVLKWAKRLGVTGLIFSGLQQAAVATVPHTVDAAWNPVAEVIGFHRGYEAVTKEPSDAAPSQGQINDRSTYLYEMRLSRLDTKGSVFGRFRGDSQTPSADKDPRWWTIRGNSDGKLAELSYTDEEGHILGNIELKMSADSALWVGHLTGLDRSISDQALVQNPIIVAQSAYDASRIQADKFLDAPSVLIPNYNR
jgi:hypothetical protein